MSDYVYAGWVGRNAAPPYDNWRVLGPAAYDRDVVIVEIGTTHGTVTEEWSLATVERLARQGSLKRPT